MSQEPIEDYIGLTMQEARQLASDRGQVLRITKRNSNIIIVTMELRTNRVNLELEDNLITAASTD